jgi:hypothetical protein
MAASKVPEPRRRSSLPQRLDDFLETFVKYEKDLEESAREHEYIAALLDSYDEGKTNISEIYDKTMTCIGKIDALLILNDKLYSILPEVKQFLVSDGSHDENTKPLAHAYMMCESYLAYEKAAYSGAREHLRIASVDMFKQE